MKLISVLLFVFLFAGCSEPVKESAASPKDAHAGHDHAGHDHAGHDHAGHDHSKEATAKLTSTENRAVLKVEKMDCGGCAKKIKKALYQFPGIKSLDTNPATRMVVIEIADKEKFDLDKAVSKIKNDAGYDAVIQ